MSPAALAALAVLVIVVAVVAWSTFVGGSCSKDAQCPAGYACTVAAGASKGRCTLTGSS
jgi:hypothetical protein